MSEWIKVEWHNITKEERKEKRIPDEFDYVIDGYMPDDDEEILVTDGEYVWLDVSGINDDGYYLVSGYDWTSVTYWMPLPIPPNMLN